jgi:hypothetical protein
MSSRGSFRLRRFALALILGTAGGLRSFATVSVAGPLAYDYVVQIGRTYEGSLEIRNTSDAPASVRIYQTDYLFYTDGTVVYGEAGTVARSNARWITVSPGEARLPAGESATVRYSIKVPDDPALAGSFWSVLMVEPSPEKASTVAAGKDASSTVAIQQIVRYAVQISTQVGDTGDLDLRFSQLQLAADLAGRHLLVDAENTGDRWYRATVWAELYDANGGLVGRYDAGASRMYPGTSVRFRCTLAGVKSGSYSALIVADCGGDDVYGVTVNVVLQ